MCIIFCGSIWISVVLHASIDLFLFYAQLMGCMHSLNLLFLLVDTFLNSMVRCLNEKDQKGKRQGSLSNSNQLLYACWSLTFYFIFFSFCFCSLSHGSEWLISFFGAAHMWFFNGFFMPVDFPGESIYHAFCISSYQSIIL